MIHTYRVWDNHGLAVLVNARNTNEAREKALTIFGVGSKVAKVEQLD